MVDGDDAATMVDGANQADSLHILPLATIRLNTPGLRRARIVKNARLESMIELFSDDQTGSGQIRPAELPKFIEMRGAQKADLVVVKRLCGLPSYDVYSLRIALRELGIRVNDQASLQISPACRRQLSAYVGRYTRPMLESIYGEAQAALLEVNDLAALFTDDRAEEAKVKLIWLADRLKIELRDVPLFISEYGDVSSSLAFYEYGLDKIAPALDSFLQALADIQHSRLRTDADLMKTCQVLEHRLTKLRAGMAALFGRFEGDTRLMWQRISATAFNNMKRRAAAYYMGLGGSLCAITVKVHAWKNRFPSPEAGSLPARAEFIRHEMLPGMDILARIGAALEPAPAAG